MIQGRASNDEEGLKEQKQNRQAARNKEKTERKDERVRQTLTHSGHPASLVSLLSLLSVSRLHIVFLFFFSLCRDHYLTMILCKNNTHTKKKIEHERTRTFREIFAPGPSTYFMSFVWSHPSSPVLLPPHIFFIRMYNSSNLCICCSWLTCLSISPRFFVVSMYYPLVMLLCFAT